MVELSAYGSAALAPCAHPLAQVRFGFHPFAISHTPQAFPVGVRLQNVSSQKPSVSKTRLTLLLVHERTVSVSAFTAAGLFPHSTAALASAELSIVFPEEAHVSTCKSYVIIQLFPHVTDTEEKVRVGAVNDSLGEPQLSYVKL